MRRGQRSEDLGSSLRCVSANPKRASYALPLAQLDSIALARARAVSLFMASMAIGIGALVLLGWTFEIMLLKAAFSSGLTMKANTALAVCATGTAVLLLRPPDAGAIRKRLGQGFSFFALVIGGATLSEHIAGWDLGIDQLLFREPAGAIATTSPGRMGLPASISFALLGIALLSLDHSHRTRVAISQLLASLVALIAMLPILGYITGAAQLYIVAPYTGIAAHSALALMAIAASVFFARPESRPAAVFVLKDAGGQLARGLLPATVMVPIGLWVLRGWFERTGLLDPSFARALVLLSFIVLFTLLVWLTAMRLSSEARARDRAEQKLAELLASERAARAEAERAAKLKDDFVATVSHELRTPLNAMLGWASMVRTKSIKPEEVAHGLSVIERNARLQARLIDDLLDISRIVSGKLRLDAQRLDVCAVVRSAISAVAPDADGKSIAIDASFEPHALFITGDPARLQQVVWNLLSNAVKFTPKGGSIAIEVRAVPGAGQIVVRDSGMGIEPQFIPHVFDRFRQADSSSTRRHAGLGLGLSIARHLVELHHGSVEAYSDGKDRGSRFTVLLPTGDDDNGHREARTPRRATPFRMVGSDHPLEGLRVLVVDDDADGRELVGRVLTECGAMVATAGDAERALAVLRDYRAQVLVTDIGMPGKDGYALLRSVREQFDATALPAIALTAFARPEDRARALDSGFQAHLSKPVDLQALTDTIAALSPSANA
jgi:signal transduction histidine kinase/CheY-like chemotaxis protein